MANSFFFFFARAPRLHSSVFVLVRVQSALRVAMSSVLLDGHTWLVNELSHGGMGSPFDGCCRRYHGL